MKQFEIEKHGELFCYSAFVNGVFKIVISNEQLSLERVCEELKNA